jgi:hypothetical protein
LQAGVDELLHALAPLLFQKAASHRNFIIEVGRSGIHYVMLYKKALAEWRQKHGG